MREIKRNARPGEKIKIIDDKGWQLSGLPTNPFTIGTAYTVEKIYPNDTTVAPHDYSKGLVSVKENDYCIFATNYVVLED